MENRLIYRGKDLSEFSDIIDKLPAHSRSVLQEFLIGEDVDDESLLSILGVLSVENRSRVEAYSENHN
jgi:hypothetical protein